MVFKRKNEMLSLMSHALTINFHMSWYINNCEEHFCHVFCLIIFSYRYEMCLFTKYVDDIPFTFMLTKTIILFVVVNMTFLLSFWDSFFEFWIPLPLSQVGIEF